MVWSICHVDSMVTFRSKALPEAVMQLFSLLPMLQNKELLSLSNEGTNFCSLTIIDQHFLIMGTESIKEYELEGPDYDMQSSILLNFAGFIRAPL